MSSVAYHYKVYQVNRIVDGDTVDLTVDLGFGIFHKIRVRLEGIDTPETRTRDLREKAAGIRATDFLNELINNATELTLTTEKAGKYGRYLGTLWDRSHSINQTMIDEGHAEVYK
ncbi:MAG TPA: nuclease [Alteromonas australica]|uniref:Nuclease n=1 Tax=Alteromonas australica TaxID=589873 RepID=A0A350NZZ1_9ALTE|nr:nuclease [Alteromonas australica]